MSDQYGNNVDGEIWVAKPGTPLPVSAANGWYNISGMFKGEVRESE